MELQADAAADLNRRAREFYNADTYTPPEMIYSGDVRDILKREEATPEEIQAASDLLANQAAADEATKTQESLKDLTENKGLGADAAAAVPVSSVSLVTNTSIVSAADASALRSASTY